MDVMKAIQIPQRGAGSNWLSVPFRNRASAKYC